MAAAGRGGAGDADPPPVDVASTLQASGGERGWRIDAEGAAGGHVQAIPVGLGDDGELARALVSGGNDKHDVTRMTYVAEPVDDVAYPLTAREGKGPASGADSGNIVVSPLAVRGREGGAQIEVGGSDDPYFALRAGDGSSSRGALVLVEEGEQPDPERHAYVVDKEWGVPNDEGISVTATDVAPTITADGDPDERTDRGLRIVEEFGGYAPDVAATLTAGAHSPGVSAPGRRSEDDTNLVVEAVPISGDALRYGEGVSSTPSPDAEGRVRLRDPAYGVGEPGEPAQTITAAGPGAVGTYPIQDGRAIDKAQNGLGVGEDGEPAYTLDTTGAQAVGVFRKSRRAQTSDDDETWVADDVANTLNTFDTSETRATQVVVEEPRSTAIHITQSPVTGDEFSPALGCTSSGMGVLPGGGRHVVPTAAVRRLTPTECERLQAFDDGWTDIYEERLSDVLYLLCPHDLKRLACADNAEWTTALETLSTGGAAYVACTTPGSTDTGLWIYPPGIDGPTPPARRVDVRLAAAEPEGSAPPATSRGSGTATPPSPAADEPPEPPTPRATSRKEGTARTPADREGCACTDASLLTQPAGTSRRASSSTTSTWTVATTLPTISGSPTRRATGTPTAPSTPSSPNCCDEARFGLRTASTVSATSDSARYKQLGNAVPTVVPGWIGWRIVAWEKGWRPA